MFLRAYGGAFRFLLSIRRYLALCAAAFLLVTALSWLAILQFPTAAQSAMASITELMESKDLLETESPSGPEMSEAPEEVRINASKLITSNLVAMGMGVALGAVPFLFLPLLPLLLNSLLIGVLGGALQTSGLSAGYFFIAVAPHGIFEIPALLIAYSLGFCLCLTLAGNIIRSRRARSLRGTLMGIARTFVLIVTPLTIVAGLVEAYVTPLIIAGFLGI